MRINRSGKKRDRDTLNRIAVLMILKGVENKAIAKRLGVSTTMVSLVRNGHRKSRRIELAFSRALGVPVEELFPKNKEAA